MVDEFAFRCQREGLGPSLRSNLLGGYTGAGSWSIYVSNIDDADEHMVVQTHEALHHELQVSTIWGSVTSFAAVLAARDVRPLALWEVFDHGVSGSTLVHETYATYLADRVVSDRTSRDVLAGNPEYRQFRDRATRLLPIDDRIRDSVRIGATAGILRSLMQPAGMARVAEQLDFAKLRAADVARLVPESPDHRLDLLEEMNEPDGWLDLLIELSEAVPDDQERLLAAGTPTSPDTMEPLRRQWDFEVEQIQRRSFERVSAMLETNGSPSLRWADLRSLAVAVIDAVTDIDPELRDIIALGDDVPISDTDALEFARQRIVLRDPLATEAVDIPTEWIADVLDGFIVREGTDDAHVLAVWALPEILAKQFAVSPTTASVGAGTVLLARARDANGDAVARIGRLGGIADPRVLQGEVGPTPLLVLTTQLSLADDWIAAAFDHVEPVFVLMDLPIAWHLDHWVRQGAVVRWAVAAVDEERELAMLVVRIDRASQFRFFHVGGLLALGSLFERLRQRIDTEQIRYDQSVIEEDAHGLTLVASHVIHTFSTLDQDGAS